MHSIIFLRLAILSFILHWGYELFDTGNMFTSGFAQYPAGGLLRTGCFHILTPGIYINPIQISFMYLKS